MSTLSRPVIIPLFSPPSRIFLRSCRRWQSREVDDEAAAAGLVAVVEAGLVAAVAAVVGEEGAGSAAGKEPGLGESCFLVRVRLVVGHYS